MSHLLSFSRLSTLQLGAGWSLWIVSASKLVDKVRSLTCSKRRQRPRIPQRSAVQNFGWMKCGQTCQSQTLSENVPSTRNCCLDLPLQPTMGRRTMASEPFLRPPALLHWSWHLALCPEARLCACAATIGWSALSNVLAWWILLFGRLQYPNDWETYDYVSRCSEAKAATERREASQRCSN